MFTRILLDETPPEGGNGSPAPPPTATAIVEANITEADINLQEEFRKARAKAEDVERRAKKLETDVSYLQDENRRLKSISPPPPTVTKQAKTRYTFFDLDED